MLALGPSDAQGLALQFAEAAPETRGIHGSAVFPVRGDSNFGRPDIRSWSQRVY